MEYKLIVTHMNPDLDAVTAVWILKRFDRMHFGNAGVSFVPAGERISPEKLDDLDLRQDQVEHVDTGQGRFDHHSESKASKKIAAASLVLDHVIQDHEEYKDDEALKRLVDYVVEIDHFGEFYWPDPNADRYLFSLNEILGHIKSNDGTDQDIVDFAMTALDAVYSGFRARVAAELEVDEGEEFETIWGVGLAMSTANDETIKYAQKEGYVVVIRKDPEEGNIRIKAVPDKEVDLTDVYEKILARDSKATWYLHPSKKMLLNGSSKNPTQVPSQLELKEVVEMFLENKKTHGFYEHEKKRKAKKKKKTENNG